MGWQTGESVYNSSDLYIRDHSGGRGGGRQVRALRFITSLYQGSLLVGRQTGEGVYDSSRLYIGDYSWWGGRQVRAYTIDS